MSVEVISLLKTIPPENFMLKNKHCLLMNRWVYGTWTNDVIFSREINWKEFLTLALTIRYDIYRYFFFLLHIKKNCIYHTNFYVSSFSRVTNLVRLGTTNREEMNYEPGDHLYILPHNNIDHVAELLRRVRCNDVHADDLINIHQMNGMYRQGCTGLVKKMSKKNEL